MCDEQSTRDRSVRLTFGIDWSLDSAKYVLFNTPSLIISILSVLYRSIDLYWQPKNNTIRPIFDSADEREKNNRDGAGDYNDRAAAVYTN